MERLTERTENGGIQYEDRNGYYHTFYGNGAGDPVHALAKKLCELEDKIEQGTLIELPCKVGDTVYKVEREYAYSNDTYFWHIVENHFGLGMLDYVWGKMIFLTREEAEKRLKELQNG